MIDYALAHKDVVSSIPQLSDEHLVEYKQMSELPFAMTLPEPGSSKPRVVYYPYGPAGLSQQLFSIVDSHGVFLGYKDQADVLRAYAGKPTKSETFKFDFALFGGKKQKLPFPYESYESLQFCLSLDPTLKQ